ncbi:hypothetical protein [Dactylosporangium sp. NPDC051484]|uniref:hypothetical protein n=1 Tax=Dactylosporangium sp. NPDC051484 TaxID=3154942 RepID=UPI00344EC79D
MRPLARGDGSADDGLGALTKVGHPSGLSSADDASASSAAKPVAVRIGGCVAVTVPVQVKAADAGAGRDALAVRRGLPAIAGRPVVTSAKS